MLYIQVQLIHVQLIGIIQILILQFGLIIQKAQKQVLQIMEQNIVN